jgi:hypothetical protein
MEKTMSYTSQCKKKEGKPPKSKFSKPFTIDSTILKTIFQVCQSHHTYQVKAWKKKDHEKTLLIEKQTFKTNSKNINRPIPKH